MQRKYQFSLNELTLRDLAYHLEERTDLGCLIDRRIDPDQLLGFDSGFSDVTRLLDELVKEKQFKWVRAGDFIFLTTPETATQFSLLTYWKQDELKHLKPDSRQLSAWTTNTKFEWQILKTPRQFCIELASTNKVAITNPELIPHDLWSPGKSLFITPIDQLQLALVQYGLTWKWNKSTEITLIPVDPHSTLMIEFPLTRIEQKRLRNQLGENEKWTFKELTRGLQVTAKFVDMQKVYHEYRALYHSSKAEPNTVKLSNRRFTLTVKDAKVVDVLETMKKGGLIINYDPADPQLNNRASISVKDATIDQLLNQLLETTSLTYKVDGENITLKQK